MRFRNHRIVGDIVELAARYCADGADELVFYDISASPAGRTVDRHWISRVAKVLDVPFCVAGGIRSVDDAEAVLNLGADKISVNSPALQSPELISRLAKRFGTQCVVVGIDSRAVDGDYVVYQNTGDPNKTEVAGRRTMDWIDEVQRLGAGEIVLNCMNQDGVREGYDIDQLRQARQRSRIPLVASGGAGTSEHFAEVFESAHVDAALAASVFHDGDIRLPSLKRFLSTRGIEVRADDNQPDRATWQQTILSS